MSPLRIIKKALEKGIDIIAITDHNSSKNLKAAISTDINNAIKVLSGMEVSTSEEVHILALFDSIGNAMDFQRVVYKNMPDYQNDVERYGQQVVVNSKDEVIEFENKLLINASTLNIETVINKIHSFGGIAIASHIDREYYSIISQLGFIPEWLDIDGLEISRAMRPDDAYLLYGGYNKPLVSFSDAHNLDDIGSRQTELYMLEPTLNEFKLALQGLDGRRVAISSVK